MLYNLGEFVVIIYKGGYGTRHLRYTRPWTGIGLDMFTGSTT
jgi:hypothetical protein